MKLDRSYTKPRPSAYYADRSRVRRAVLATTTNRPAVDEVFAHVDDDRGYVGADQRPSTWMRAEGGAA